MRRAADGRLLALPRSPIPPPVPVPSAPLLLVPICLALAGCDVLRSFETVCETRLPPSSVTVKTEPVIHRVDHSLDASALTRKGADIVADGKIVLGLTSANLSSTVQVTARGMTRRGSARFCMRPEVEVRLSFNPMTVYMNSDDAPGSCPYRLTYAHEMRHVQVYAEFLPAVATRVEGELGRHFGSRVFYFTSADEGQQHIDEVVRDYLSPLVAEAMGEVRKLQRAVDAPAEYARLDRGRLECDAATPVSFQR